MKLTFAQFVYSATSLKHQVLQAFKLCAGREDDARVNFFKL